MTTDQLIDRLVAEARPVRRIASPRHRAAVWIALAVVCAVLGVQYFGLRRDLSSATQSVGFWLRIALLISIMWLAVTAAFRLAVPGADTRIRARWWPLVVLGALVALAAGDVVTGMLTGPGMGSSFPSWACARKVAMVGAIPAAWSLLLIQRAAPTEPQWTALLGVLGAAAAGGLTAELACPFHAPLHILVWHALPVLASVGVGLLAGTALLATMRRRR